jgi:hypothetical protein
MTKRESLDEKIAQALTAEDASVETLDGLIDDAEKAAATTKEAAEVYRARAVDPRILDSSALALAIENENYHERYTNAYKQLIKKRDQAEAATALAAWNQRADAVEAARDEVEAEFADTYQTAVATLVDLFERVQAVNNAVTGLQSPVLDGKRHVKKLDFAAAIMKNVKLPNLERTDQFLWPLFVQPFQVNMSMYNVDSRYIAGNWAEVQREARELLIKKAQLREAQEKVG